MPMTGSILPTNSDVRCDSVGQPFHLRDVDVEHVAQAKSLPVRGMKLTLADTSAVGVSAERSAGSPRWR